MLKSACLILLVAACVLLTGCKRDAEINSALTEVDSFTNDLENFINTDPSSKGVDNAQQYLDARKREIKLKTSYLTRVRGIQVSDQTEKRLIETVRRDQMKISALSTSPNLPVNDATFKTKLDKLINDYLELFQA